MIGGGGEPCPFFNCNLASALQLRKSTENLSQCSRLVLDTLIVKPTLPPFGGSLDWPAEHQSSSVAVGI
jgi:hypothetical protein